MRKRMLCMLIVVFLLTFTAGCNLPTSAGGPDSAQVAQTYAAQTIEARLTENASGQGNQGGGQNPPAVATPEAPSQPQLPTNTPLPSDTPKPAATNTAKAPCNQASFVKDVTVPDGKEYPPNTNFTKTWRLKNTGTCTWNNDYDLVFDSGDKMGGSSVVDLSIGNVAPGETADVSVDLKSPGSAGNYKGKWILRSGDGVAFALGGSDTPFFVQIEVVDAVSFTILDTNVFDCSGDTTVAIKVKNTGSDELESSKGKVKNLATDAESTYSPYNNPFTENRNDCPAMGIENMEPGDAYWMNYNLGATSGVEMKFWVTLCTANGGGGDCVTQTQKVDIP